MAVNAFHLLKLCDSLFQREREQSTGLLDLKFRVRFVRGMGLLLGVSECLQAFSGPTRPEFHQSLLKFDMQAVAIVCGHCERFVIFRSRTGKIMHQ